MTKTILERFAGFHKPIPPRAIRWLIAGPGLFILLCTAAAVAAPGSEAPTKALPESAEIHRALTDEFQTEMARPVNRHHGPLMRELEPLLTQQARYLVSRLEPWAQDSSALRFPESTNSGEHSIRPNAHTALGLAILARLAPDEAFTPGLTRAMVRENALGILRFLLSTHGAAGLVCDDAKPWRAQWQSAFWAAMAGEACWLLWDDLSPREKWLAARMICDEADRFVDQVPPAQVRRDTKAEENAWNSMVGMVLPLRKDLLVTPNPRGLIGFVEMPGSNRETPEVQEVRVADLPDALGLAGILSRGGGALGGLLFGYDTAVIAGTVEFLQIHFGLSDLALGWTVSSALLGLFRGALRDRSSRTRSGRGRIHRRLPRRW